MSLRSLSILLLLAMLGGCTIRSASGASTNPEDIFVLAGQSNMAGRGGVERGRWNKFVPPQSKPNPAILRLTARLEWTLAQEPLHSDIDVKHTCGVGPGMAFANEVKSRSPGIGVIGLVPCAVGGTKISQWAKGSNLYNQMVARARAAVKTGGTIRAILWYQGESDTVDKSDAEAYRGNMETLINNLRADLNNPSLLIIGVHIVCSCTRPQNMLLDSTIVFYTNRHNEIRVYSTRLHINDYDSCVCRVVKVALASGDGKFVETVRAAQPGISLPNVKCVDAKGLDLKDDRVHLTTTSEVKLGTKLARAYLQ